MRPGWDPFAELACLVAADGDEAAVYEDAHAVYVRLEVDARAPEEVRVDARDRLLVVTAARVSRLFTLPRTVAPEDAVAILEGRVLTVRIPRAVARRAS